MQPYSVARSTEAHKSSSPTQKSAGHLATPSVLTSHSTWYRSTEEHKSTSHETLQRITEQPRAPVTNYASNAITPHRRLPPMQTSIEDSDCTKELESHNLASKASCRQLRKQASKQASKVPTKTLSSQDAATYASKH